VIVTVTPNPSVDRTYELPELHAGHVVRATALRTDPGGKGLNVAWTLAAAGHQVLAVVPIGGHDGELLRDELAARGVAVVAVPIGRSVRSNASLVTPDGTVTKVNAPGPALSTEEAAALEKATLTAAHGATWVAACGSLPPGADDDWYARLVRDAQEVGALVAIDASDAPLTAAIAAGPDLIKPNREELAGAVGRDLATLGDVVTAAAQLRARGVGAVVASLGADGAVLVSGEGSWHATRPPLTPVSAVGAGDALLAGVLGVAARTGLTAEALRAGVAHGAAAALLPGTSLPRPTDLDLDVVTVTDVDPAHPLTTGSHG
jgi:1-phosphofructokinase